MTRRTKTWTTTLLLLLVGLATMPPAEASPTEARYLVGFEDMPSIQEGDAYHGGIVTHVNPTLRYVTVTTDDPTSLLSGTATDANVRYVELDVLQRMISFMPNDPLFLLQYGPQQINAPAAWDTTLGGGASICIPDTGVRYTHEDLTAGYAGGYDFVNNDNDPWDDHGHGTHVAGTAAASIDNVKGIAGVSIAPHYSTKVLDSSGSGFWQWVADGVQWCADNGPANTVISMSLGGSGGTQVMEDAVTYAASKGNLLVAAAGNSYGGAIGYPAAYPEVVAVTCTDSNRNLCVFSSVGSQAELAAPGNAILSSCSVSDIDYCSMSGTSMSTPHVAGAAALLWDFNSQLTNGELRKCLQDSALDLGAPGRDSSFGYGEVDASAALLECPPGPTLPTLSSSTHSEAPKFHNAPDFQVSWTHSGQNIDGYSYDFVNAGTTWNLDCVKDVEETTTSKSFSVSSFSRHVFRIRAIDNAGNCGPAAEYEVNTDRVDPLWTRIAPTGHIDNVQEPVEVVYEDKDLGDDLDQDYTKVDVDSVRIWVDGIERLPTSVDSSGMRYDPGTWTPGDHEVRVAFADESVGANTVSVSWEFTVIANETDINNEVDEVFRVVNDCTSGNDPTCQTVWECTDTPPSGGPCRMVYDAVEDCLNGSQAPCDEAWDCLDGSSNLCEPIWQCTSIPPSGGACKTVHDAVKKCLNDEAQTPCSTVWNCLDGSNSVCQEVWDCTNVPPTGGVCRTVYDAAMDCINGVSPCDAVQKCIDGEMRACERVWAIIGECIPDDLAGWSGDVCGYDVEPPCTLNFHMSSPSSSPPDCHTWLCDNVGIIDTGVDVEALLMCGSEEHD